MLSDLKERDRADFNRVMDLTEGARFVAGLIDFCRTFEANPEGKMFAEGMRNVGLMLFARIRDAPAGEFQYIKARLERREAFDRAAETEEEEGPMKEAGQGGEE